MGALGVGYAYWTTNLYINGSATAATWGTIIASKVDSGLSDSQKPPVATGSSVISADQKTITITVSNVYPGYTGICPFTVQDTGGVPVKLATTAGASNSKYFSISADPGSPVAANGGTWIYTVTIAIPATETVSTFPPSTSEVPNTVTASYTIAVSQFNAVP